MKNSIAWVLGHTSNMLIAGLSATMPNPFGMAMVLTLDNVVCDHSMTQRLNWQTVLTVKRAFQRKWAWDRVGGWKS